jgi:hypothetical protein
MYFAYNFGEFCMSSCYCSELTFNI